MSQCCHLQADITLIEGQVAIVLNTQHHAIDVTVRTGTPTLLQSHNESPYEKNPTVGNSS